MKKILSISILIISFSVILLLPKETLAINPCSYIRCDGPNSGPCSCGGSTLSGVGEYCWAAGSAGSQVFTAYDSCIAAMNAGGGGQVTGVLESCVLTKPGAQLPGCTVGSPCVFDAISKCGICCFLQTLYKVTDWIFVILVALAGLFVVLGAMNLLMSAGDPSKVTSGRQYIMYAVIGLIIGFLAKAIPTIARLVVGT